MLNLFFKIRLTDKIIIHAIFFNAPRLSGGSGDAKSQLWVGLHKIPGDAGFTGARRRSDDDYFILNRHVQRKERKAKSPISSSTFWQVWLMVDG